MQSRNLHDVVTTALERFSAVYAFKEGVVVKYSKEGTETYDFTPWHCGCPAQKKACKHIQMYNHALKGTGATAKEVSDFMEVASVALKGVKSQIFPVSRPAQTFVLRRNTQEKKTLVVLYHQKLVVYVEDTFNE